LTQKLFNEKVTSKDELINQLNIIYAQVPAFECRKGCTDCCGIIGWSEAEDINIRAYLSAHGIPYRRGTSIHCPYSSNGNCEIYPVRPIVCRLFGVVEGALDCPHVKVEKKLPPEEARRLRKAIVDLEVKP